MIRKVLKRKNLCLIVLVLFFVYFLVAYSIGYFNSFSCLSEKSLLTDLLLINDIAKSVGFYIYIFDAALFTHSEYRLDSSKKSCVNKPVIFGIEFKSIKNTGIETVVKYINAVDFNVEVFFNTKSSHQRDEYNSPLSVAIVIQKSHTYILHIIYSREDNTWWFGSIADDEDCIYKVNRLSPSSIGCRKEEWHASALNKFHFTKRKPLSKVLIHFLTPNENEAFLSEFMNSNFIECNVTRAALFRERYGKSSSSEALRFKHKAWKILSKVKTVLDILSISFWLSSGTCLGFFRECDIIPYSKDVDIGIFAKDFNDNIIIQMESNGFKLKHWFGEPNDSLELSFIDKGGAKLDIFFFYEENNYFWNGGTQLRTQKKFKYIFPKFDLCWTIFCGLRVRVPCQTETYIIANYGAHWFTPIKYWDWKTSPNNVQENGFWPISSKTSILL